MSNERGSTSSVGPGVRRLCIAVDLEKYSTRSDVMQREAQRMMKTIMQRAGDQGALERAQWLTQEQGDGELALLPPGIDEADVITALMRQLRHELHVHNRRSSPEARLRMRVAVHEGVTYVAENGFAGDAINTVCRLRDTRALKEALAAAVADVVLIVSDRIYQDVIKGNDAYDLGADTFRMVDASIVEKGFRARAWVHVPSAAGGPNPPEGERRAAPEPEPPDKGGPRRKQRGEGASGTFNFGDNTTVRDIAGQDINNHYPERPEQ